MHPTSTIWQVPSYSLCMQLMVSCNVMTPSLLKLLAKCQGPMFMVTECA